MRVPLFVMIAALACLPGAAPAGTGKEPLSCLDCHSEKVSQAEFTAGAHGVLGCTGCHEVTKFPHEPKPAKPKCATCHSDEVKQHAESLHGKSRANGHWEAATCFDCHGDVHVLKKSDDPTAKTSKINLPDTCGRCHSNPELVAKFNIPIARPIDAYRQSVHGRAVQRGVTAAPACSDCHGVHALFPASDLRSKVNRAQVPATCGRCHTEIAAAYRRSVHGRAAARGVNAVPVCTDCHGEHSIRRHTDPTADTYSTNLSADLCSRCHDDRRLNENFNMPVDRAATYFESFHGLASRSGAANVANCASCHGVHDIRAASDPASSVNSANLSKTCGKCHPNAGQRFALGKIHVPPEKTATRMAGLVREFYVVLIPLVVGLMLLHNVFDLRFKARRKHAARAPAAVEAPREMYFNERLQHYALAVSFIVLVITGFALKFPEMFWARPIVAWEGKWPLRAWVHRGAAVLLIATAIYHLIYLAANRQGRKHWMELMPKRRDVPEVIGAVRQYFGGPAARLSTYNYIHKAEYWALVWGTMVMAASGLVLWFNTFSLRYLPRWVIDFATTIHYYEAILAALAILVWHGYSVIFDPDVYPMDWTWWTGKHEHSEQ